MGIRNLRGVIIFVLCLTGIGLVIAGSGQGGKASGSFLAGARAHVTRPGGIFAKRPTQTLSEMKLATIPPVATRTSFMARWSSVPGALGYRLDVSTSRAFTDFVEGYRDLDVGNVTGRVVTGLSQSATYYYRLRAYNAFGLSRESGVRRVATTATTGLIINATFDSSILNDPNAVAIESMINQAINIEESLFTDPVTINIAFRWTTSADPCGPIGGGFLGRSCTSIYNEPWNTYISALMADAKTSNDAAANASLPSGALSTNITVSSANGRALGFNTPGGLSYIGGTYDATITLNSGASFQFTRPTSANNYDALRTTEHEIDEVMGLGSGINGRSGNYRPQDLFSWQSAGVRNFSSSGTRYFSINSGTTDIVDLNQDPSGDFGDWFSGGCPQAQPYVQNAFSCSGQYSDVTATSPEGINLDVIGYDLAVSTTQTLTVASLNPSSGVSIQVSPTDNNGASDGITQFTRTYDNNTSVSLTAPLTANGNTFLKWQRDGSDWDASNLTSVAMDTSHTITAVYSISSGPDFNGDGKVDYVLYNPTTHQTALWYLNNNVKVGGAYGPSLPAGWDLVDTADFNGDTKPDYVLFNSSTRQTAIWYISGGARVGGAFGPTIATGFALVATADFNGDGKPDYLLYNSATRATAVYYLNGNAYSGSAYGPTLASGYMLAGTADFNGDGKPDLALFNPSTRKSVIWYLSGSAYLSGAYGPTITNSYQLVGTADFNGDGKPDFVLYNPTSRQTAIWYLNNNVLTSSKPGPTLPEGYSLAAP